MARNPKTELENILDTSVDIKNRRIFFGSIEAESENSHVNWSNVEVVIRGLYKLSSDYKHAPIELHMCSEGGDTDQMFRLYDAILSCPCQIKFFGSGIVASAAAYIMVACDERYVTPNTQIMLHKLQYSVPYGATTDNDILINSIKSYYNPRMMEILANNSRMSVDFWTEVTKRDLYLTPEEALTLGLIDGIVEYKKRGNLRKKRTHLLKQHDHAAIKRLVREISRRIENPKSIKVTVDVPVEQYDSSIYIESPQSEPHSEEQ